MTPATILEGYAVKISRDGKLAQLKFSLGPDYMEGPLQILSAMLSKYPKVQKFKLSWQMSVGSSSESVKVFYNRQIHALKFDDRGGMGTSFWEKHILYIDVADPVIHDAANQEMSSNTDGGFLFLDKYGCEKRYFHHKETDSGP